MFLPHYVAHQLAEYKPKKNATHIPNRDAAAKLTQALINSLDICDRTAVIGLLLLIRKDIASEYKWFSPRKGFFFGSSLYTICEDTLKDLGITLNPMTPEDEKKYFTALNGAMQKIDAIKNDPYIKAKLEVQGPFPPLSKEPPVVVDFDLPLDKVDKEGAAVDKHKSENAATPVEPFPEELAILTGKKDVSADPDILLTASGIYKLNKPPIGKGGWGSVYSAVHYSLVDGHVVVNQQPFAIKQIRAHQSVVLEKEHQLFQKAYPGQQFERVRKGNYACLAMPLLAGDQLEKYLQSHGDLPLVDRQQMAVELLADLNRIHKNGITHNDLKPKNILYDPQSKKIHIIDFGCAQDLNTKEQLQYRDVNTSVFAFEFPPEYLTGTQTNTGLDIYSMTPIVAEVLGINKRVLVQSRLDKILPTINEPLRSTIQNAFDSSDTLEEALFTGILYPHIYKEEFQRFVRDYSALPYDFGPYKKQLGDETIAMLDAMQSRDPTQRPNLEACIAILQAAMQKQVQSVKAAKVEPFPNILTGKKEVSADPTIIRSTKGL